MSKPTQPTKPRMLGELTPVEMRAVRVFRSVPEESRPKFFELMEVICAGCGWHQSALSPLRAVMKGDRS